MRVKEGKKDGSQNLSVTNLRRGLTSFLLHSVCLWGLAHSQGVGMTQGHDYQVTKMIGSHLKSLLIDGFWSGPICFYPGIGLLEHRTLGEWIFADQRHRALRNEYFPAYIGIWGWGCHWWCKKKLETRTIAITGMTNNCQGDASGIVSKQEVVSLFTLHLLSIVTLSPLLANAEREPGGTGEMW